MDKPNCYECQYRGSVPGDAHSCCNHPAYDYTKDNPMLKIMSSFAGVGRIAPVIIPGKDIIVKGNLYGIRSGWFNHPFNFDPVWLESCTGFKQEVMK